MKKLLILAAIVMGMVSCQKDDLDSDYDQESESVVSMVPRTVVIYMSAENNLGKKGFLTHNYNDIVNAAKSLPDNDNLLLYIDNYNEKPYIVKVDKNGASTVKSYDTESYASDPAQMKEVLQWCYTQYPSSSYGLVLWGHGSGWLVANDQYSITTRAYGLDTGVNMPDSDGKKWMNIPDMAKVLSLTPHLDYIFSDCCNMQSAEVAYELRGCADYLIGSPAEIPGYGAPYSYVLKNLFAGKESVGKLVVDDYENYGSFYGASGLPLSVVKTSEMEQLATATSKALATFMSDYKDAKDVSLDNIIYYQEESDIAKYAPISYDIRDFMKHYLPASAYSEWMTAFSKAVVYAVHPADVHTSGKDDWTVSGSEDFDFLSFYLTDDNFGGMSMFIPQSKYSNSGENTYIDPNKSITTMAWGQKINWSQWGN